MPVHFVSPKIPAACGRDAACMTGVRNSPAIATYSKLVNQNGSNGTLSLSSEWLERLLGLHYQGFE